MVDAVDGRNSRLLTRTDLDDTLSPGSFKEADTMELSWTMKLRIAAAAAVGVGLIGILGWHLAAPSEMTDAVIGPGGAVTLLLLALLAGLIGYLVSWPYGREIGILTVPFGLSVWAVRSGTMAALIQLNSTGAERQSLVQLLKWQPIFWLIVVAAGFAGPLVCRRLLPPKEQHPQPERPKANPTKYLNVIMAVAATAFIAQLCIGIFAQDTRLSDDEFGSVLAQPAIGQIGFAVLLSFGLAAFAVRKLLGVGYVWPIIATVVVTVYSVSVYANNMPYLAQQWPAVFFANASSAVLPVQMVAFGTLGSIAGYWMAARYDYWRKYEM
jgi:hypothetical protein